MFRRKKVCCKTEREVLHLHYVFGVVSGTIQRRKWRTHCRKQYVYLLDDGNEYVKRLFFFWHRVYTMPVIPVELILFDYVAEHQYYVW